MNELIPGPVLMSMSFGFCFIKEVAIRSFILDLNVNHEAPRLLLLLLMKAQEHLIIYKATPVDRPRSINKSSGNAFKPFTGGEDFNRE